MFWYLSAWVMGLIGSTHCIGMCGPLALSLPVNANSLSGRLFQALLYNLGRVVTYTVLGAGIGFGASVLIPLAVQSSFSVFLGAAFVLLGVILFFSGRFNAIQILPKRWNQWVTITMVKFMGHGHPGKVFVMGILNGLLPCGLVYMALVTAFASGSMLASMGFMAFFGLGTMPAMWAAVFFSQYLQGGFRQILRKLYPVVYILIGTLLMLRGFNDTKHSDTHQQMKPHLFCTK